MSKTRINILIPMPFWHPATSEFIEELKKRGFSVVALDIWSFTYFDENEEYHNLVPNFLKGFFAKVYKRISRKYIIKKHIQKSDIVDIQWCGYYYSKYILFVKKRTSKLIATLFGSDFYRATNEERKIQAKIFEEADIVVIGPNMKEDFLEVFPHIENKISFGQYGSQRLDIIDEINTEENRKAFREKYSIPQDKIVVSVGYNAKKEQQHLKFLKLLDSLSQDKKDKLLLFFPLTYGKEGNYINELK
ncbi:MAG: glycosyltransferase family 4 protein, partial [Bacteroidales bacterium]|nr:glycosyltransferase family 4 protein [Bacteroidales bacterium]